MIGRMLRLPLTVVPRRATVPVLSGLNRGLRWRVGSSVHGCWIGNYEPEKQELIKRLVKPGMCVFDIGANAGFYTLAFSRLVGEEGQVWGFEPFAENVASILNHLRHNNLSNVTVFQTAVCDKVGVEGFLLSESNATGRLGQGGKYLVPTFSIDALVKDLGLPRPHIVKIDVEGAESRVLAGACDLLEQRTTVWVIALHGEDQRSAVPKILRQSGYEIFLLDGTLVEGALFTDEIYAVPKAQ